jgi:hypothetical protein
MVTRITINLPQSLAESIAVLATEQLRPPKEQIIWLLREAVRISTVQEIHEGRKPNTHPDRGCACASKG